MDSKRWNNGVQPRARLKPPELLGRQANKCPLGGAFYRCSVSNFSGCCSVDPCALRDGCPDDAEEGNVQDKAGDGKSDSSYGDKTETLTSSPVHTTISTSVITKINDQLSTAMITATTQEGVPVPTGTGMAGMDSNTTSDENKTSEYNAGSIVGTVVGGVAAGFILLVLVVLHRRKTRRAATFTETGHPISKKSSNEFLASGSPISKTASTMASGKISPISGALPRCHDDRHIAHVQPCQVANVSELPADQQAPTMIPLRATLRPTGDEIQQQIYATSWSIYDTGSVVN